MVWVDAQGVPLDAAQFNALSLFLTTLGCNATTTCPALSAPACPPSSALACANGTVRSLTLTKMGLSGSLHATALSELTGLSVLWLQENALRSTLPTTLGLLTLLTDLRLFQNSIDGPLISELGRLTRLQALGLGAMRLRGAIPTSFAALSQLTGIDLNFNDLDQTPLPAFLARWTSLSHFACNGCRLVGTLPSELLALSSLTFLELRDNKLSGTLSSFANLTRLARLSLDENEFSGSAPALPTSLTTCTLQTNSPAERSCLACRGDPLCICASRSCATSAPPTSTLVLVETGIFITTTTASSTARSNAPTASSGGSNSSVLSSTMDGTVSGTADSVAPNIHELPLGAVVGGTIGGLLLLLALIVGVLLLVRKRRTAPAAASETFHSSFNAPQSEYGSPGSSIFKAAMPITYTSLGSPTMPHAVGDLHAPQAAPNKRLYTAAPTLTAPHMPPRESERTNVYQDAPAPENVATLR